MSPEGTTVRSGVAAAHETVYNAGLTERRDVLGDEYVDAALTRNAGLHFVCRDLALRVESAATAWTTAARPAWPSATTWPAGNGPS